MKRRRGWGFGSVVSCAVLVLPLGLTFTGCGDDGEGGGSGGSNASSGSCESNCEHIADNCAGTAELEDCLADCRGRESAAQSAGCDSAFRALLDCCNPFDCVGSSGSCFVTCSSGFNTCSYPCQSDWDAVKACVDANGTGASGTGASGTGGAGTGECPTLLDQTACENATNCWWSDPKFFCGPVPDTANHRCDCNDPGPTECCDPTHSLECFDPSWPACEALCTNCNYVP